MTNSDVSLQERTERSTPGERFLRTIEEWRQTGGLSKLTVALWVQLTHAAWFPVLWSFGVLWWTGDPALTVFFMAVFAWFDVRWRRLGYDA